MQQERSFPAIAPFTLSATYIELHADSPENVHELHAHNACEIYVNVSGDVAFCVEEHIYPVAQGDVILTRPFEYHHCIYRSDRLHRHFWILFSSEGNEGLLPTFFDRKSGEGNRLTLPSEQREELFALCSRLCGDSLTASEQYGDFFRLLTLLHCAEVPHTQEASYPEALRCALARIRRDFALPLTVRSLAKEAHVSVNTLERYFQRFLQTSPTTYLRQKRLTHAAMCLSRGDSVTQAAEQSGFADYSGFIALFRQSYGITPLQYQKRQWKP